MLNIQDLKNKQEKICVVGLGYVGLPLAVLLAKCFKVVGFDVNEKRIAELKSHKDHTLEVKESDLQAVNIDYTFDQTRIKECRFIIVAVPTPVDKNKIPDMGLVERATAMVGKNLSAGSIISYESTVYPGATEDICIPILEKASGLKFGVDFKIGYSPERVNPGDKEHTIDRVVKVVSGSDKEALEIIDQVYGSITKTFKAVSIKVAEAAKVIENTQRDLNIALMNELAVLFNKMGFSVYDVLEAAGTKWNFLPFKPGLVGGHCIGVDPYYLTYKAQEYGHNPEVILAGRGINDSMHKFIAHQIIREMVKMGKNISQSKFVILGLTFKENVPDIRNSKIAELYEELKGFGVEPYIYDPHADRAEVLAEYGITMSNKEDLPKADSLIIAVAHDEFKNLTPTEIRDMMNTDNLLLADIKHLFNKIEIEAQGIKYWTL